MVSEKVKVWLPARSKPTISVPVGMLSTKSLVYGEVAGTRLCAELVQ